MNIRWKIPFFIIFLQIHYGSSTEEIYNGKRLGELSSYHHQVGGEVFAVDESTFFIKDFMYDGTGKDTFFWAGSRPRPINQGFLVPNEYGRTNVLESYRNKDIKIKLPGGKRISEIKWLSVYDLTRLESFGDIYIPEGFDPPHMVTLPRFRSKSERVASDEVIVVNSKTLLINNFQFDGRGEVYFTVGLSPIPNSRGTRIPGPSGYMTPLRAYDGQSLVMTLPGDMDVFTINWLALLDFNSKEILGEVIIPNELNVPPSLVRVTPHHTDMPNCEQLHTQIQIAWDIFGEQITVEIAANMDENDYVAFGISGSQSEPKMQDGDAVILYRDAYSGYAVDYNITAYFPCTEVIKGQKRGVCEDEKVQGQNNYQMLRSAREDGISFFQFRRPLVTPDHGDKPYPKSGEALIIWALGRLDHLDTNPRPTMHVAWSKVKQTLNFGRLPQKNCFPFSHQEKPVVTPWDNFRLTHPSNNLTFHLGPDGGPKGYTGITGESSATGLAWYVEGQLIPEIYLKRDMTYYFHVYGGSNAYDPTNYHPLIVTDEPRGAFSQLKEMKKKDVRIFAGVETSVRGDLRPLRGGDTCKWEHPPGTDRRRDIERTSFADFRNSLSFSCNAETPKPGIIEITPNRSWPDVVYYHSWTGEKMGWKLHILDPQ